MNNILSNLHPIIRKLWYEKGFDKPTLPQRKAIPLIMQGKNVLLVAPTGTGKTEAAFLPILSKILYEKEKIGIKLLYITPLRTLNRDILSRLQWWSLKTDLKISVRHGDTSQSERRIQALKPPDILITTPETLQLLLIGRKLRESLKTLKFIVVDEIHEIASSKRGTQLSILLRKLYDFLLEKNIQIIGLSATIGNPSLIARYIFSFSKDFEIVYAPVSKLIEIKVVWPTITENDYELSKELNTTPSVVSRARYIEEIVSQSNSILIFTNTRPTAEILGSRLHLINEKLPIYVHHGSLSQNQRIKIEEMLRRGEIKGIVCTSSMELGIDIGYIDKVIQYNSPREVKRLVQRIGRSGHTIGGKSKGIIVVGNTHEALEAVALLKRLEYEEIEKSEPYIKPLDVLAHEIIGFILSNVRNMDKIYSIIKSVPAYEELERDEYNSLITFLEDINLIRRTGPNTLAPAQRTFEYFYNTLSTIPEIKQYVVRNTDNKVIGLLDDYFVSEYIEPGVTFLMGGRPWEVISLKEDEVIVKESEEFWGAIPSWIGEEIPVPYETALMVGKIRKKMKELLKSGLTFDQAVMILSNELNIDNKLLYKAFTSFYKSLSEGYSVPTSDEIIVEKCKDNIIIYAHFGTKVNRAIGKYLSFILARMLSSSIHVLEKPYYIVLKSENLDIRDVIHLLKNITVDKFMKDITLAVVESRLFRWRLQQIARKMGVIEHDKTLTRSELDRLMIALRETPVYRQALNETLNRDLNISKALNVIEEIARGKIKVYSNGTCSYFSRETLSLTEEYMEIVKPGKKELLEKLILKSKILSSFVTLSCSECGYIEELPFLRLKEKRVFECPICGSKKLAFDTISEKEMNLRYQKCKKTKRGKGCRNYKESIVLLREYGIYSIIARLAGLSFKEIESFLQQNKDVTEDTLLNRLVIYLREKRYNTI